MGKESSPKQANQGWPAVAKLITYDPSFQAFQAFRDLRVKSLLYYQAELVLLREKLEAVELRDSQAGKDNSIGDTSKFGTDLASLIASRSSKDPRLCEQWSLITQIRSTLNEYDTTLLNFSQISNIAKPEPFNVEALRKMLQAKVKEGWTIMGPGANTWGDFNIPSCPTVPLKVMFTHLLRSIFFPPERELNMDLVAPYPVQEIDGLTRWVLSELIPFNSSLFGKRSRISGEEEQISIDAAERGVEVAGAEFTTGVYHISRLTRIIVYSTTTLLACLVPIAAVTALANLHRTDSLLGTIAAFTVIFALLIMAFTTAGRVEVFTATAAFIGVLVVFIQGAGSNNTIGS